MIRLTTSKCGCGGRDGGRHKAVGSSGQGCQSLHLGRQHVDWGGEVGGLGGQDGCLLLHQLRLLESRGLLGVNRLDRNLKKVDSMNSLHK